MSRYREIPFNYTSADDSQVVRLMLGDDTWELLQRLRKRRITGRSARLIMRFIGDIFVLHRNPFVFQELIDSKLRRKRFLSSGHEELETVRVKANGETEVISLIEQCQSLLDEIEERLIETPKIRKNFLRKIGSIIGESNVFFDPFTLVSHSTDATDWRLYLPFAVVRPENEEQIPCLVKEISGLGLRLIPRGAGTGLTGGCVPVRPECVMLNTEKLNRIRGIRIQQIAGGDVPVLDVDAGVITENAIQYAAERQYVFATDPTSAWASTIGGNIAENAGGKTAVLWGTAIDNILSYRIVMPDGSTWKVVRRDHPQRKIEPSDTVIFDVYSAEERLIFTVSLRGDEIRKPGLWKDITNKALGGLPAIQKEGTDGVITSATFVLHKPYPYKRTYCLEFFGSSIDEAAEVILGLSKAFPNAGKEALMALEHFDDEYVRAIEYKVKAPRGELPKAVLLVDMVGYTKQQLESGHRQLSTLLKAYPNTFLFKAKDKEEAVRFWKDRKRLGAIAARTNAFKLNEDIVLPLETLAEFARYVEKKNIGESRYTQLKAIRRIHSYLQTAQFSEGTEWLEAKLPKVNELCEHHSERIENADSLALRDLVSLDHFRDEIKNLFSGFSELLSSIDSIWDEEQARVIVIATHMHAGDGNVHVNIPVFSNDREMMERAILTADEVMEKAVKLGGVVSGEHGIGFTKIKYLDQDRITQLSQYRDTIDPDRLMNPGKLEDLKVQDQVFTPSFNLLELEARILQHGSLEALSEKIAKCVRCGRCKSDCCVFYPARNMFYHPRNKNLAIGALIEALLYDTQRSHSTRFEALRHLETIADHCTICHKCLKPCPVDIDTGEVSVLEREILEDRAYRRTPFSTRLTLKYLESRSRLFNAAFKSGVLQFGGAVQRRIAGFTGSSRKNRTGKGLRNLFNSPIPATPGTSLWDILPKCGNNQALLISPEEASKGAVFYFPGCGSERLFSEVSKSALFLLLLAGRKVVLPPPFLCCGFPARVNAKSGQHGRIVLRDTIIFSQIREMFRYLRFESCVVTCGTCREALLDIGLSEVFDCPLQDINLFISETKIASEVQSHLDRYYYHAPCHDSLDGKGERLLSDLFESDVHSIPHCCSEAGTLSLSRPDITHSMLIKKSEAIRDGLQELQTNDQPGSPEPEMMVTNCPSCLQGLGRQQGFGLKIRHISSELAIQIGGENWEVYLAKLVEKSEVVTF